MYTLNTYIHVVVVLVANPKKTTLHGRQSRSWSAEQGKKKRKKSGTCVEHNIVSAVNEKCDDAS